MKINSVDRYFSSDGLITVIKFPIQIPRNTRVETSQNNQVRTTPVTQPPQAHFCLESNIEI